MMKFNKIKSCLAVVLTLLLAAGCSDFTDIQPKGKSLLNTVNDLDLLLNQDKALTVRPLNNVGGSAIFSYDDVTANFLVENKSLSTLLFGFFDDDASIKRIEELTTSDDYYSTCYSWIGKMANPILTQLSVASGDDTKKNALRSEALAWRAYGHYLILQKFAKAYNPAKAAQDPGVIYLTEDVDITQLQPKKTVQECYDLALKDINEAISLDGVPKTPTSKQRLSKAAVYAIKAHICMAMQKYTEAEDAAKKALELGGSLNNYWSNVTTKTNSFGGSYQESVFESLSDPEVYLCIPDYFNYLWVDPKDISQIEPGYARWYLYPKSSDAYRGKPDDGEPSPDERVGLPGWDGPASDHSTHDNISGLAAPNMYLIIAEAELRKGDIGEAMHNLDILRQSRLPEDKYQPLQGVVTTKGEAIKKLQQVSFEELLFTGWTFMQRKRWNTESEWATTLSRTIAGVTYTLEPGSNLWVFPIPKPARDANPNLTSNKNK